MAVDLPLSELQVKSTPLDESIQNQIKELLLQREDAENLKKRNFDRSAVPVSQANIDFSLERQSILPTKEELRESPKYLISNRIHSHFNLEEAKLYLYTHFTLVKEDYVSVCLS